MCTSLQRDTSRTAIQQVEDLSAPSKVVMLGLVLVTVLRRWETTVIEFAWVFCVVHTRFSVEDPEHGSWRRQPSDLMSKFLMSVVTVDRYT